VVLLCVAWGPKRDLRQRKQQVSRALLPAVGSQANRPETICLTPSSFTNLGCPWTLRCQVVDCWVVVW
jgi:hypothetical protein